MSESRLRVGVIGTGYGAEVHVPGLNRIPNVDVAAICATRIEHAMRVAQRYRIPEHFQDYREMLDRCALDAISIVVPPGQQHQIAIAGAEHNVHMMCEKPMGSSAAEARDMHRLVEEANLVHAVNFQGRYLPAHRAFKRLVDKGFIGDLESVTVTGYRTPWTERRSGAASRLDSGERSAGLLNAVGSDYVDLLRWCFGEFDAVCGALGVLPANRSRQQARENSFSMLLRFKSGASGTMHFTDSAAVSFGNEVVASGEDGVLVLQSDGQLFGSSRTDQRMKPIQVEDFDDRDLASVPTPRMLPFMILANDWVQRILGEQEFRTLPTFYDGMKVQEVLHGVQRSERLSRWIDLSGNKWPVQW